MNHILTCVCLLAFMYVDILLLRKVRHHIIPPLAFWYKSFNYPLRRLVHINKTLEKENSSAWYCKFRKITNFLIW